MEPNYSRLKSVHHAMGYAHVNNGARLVELLSANPELVNVTGYKGRTPLMIASGVDGSNEGHTDACHAIASKLLIDHGANVHTLDEDGCSALAYAVAYGAGHIDNLLRAGADLNKALEMVLTMSRRGWCDSLMHIHTRLLEYERESEPEEAAVYRNVADYIVQWVRNSLPDVLDRTESDPQAMFCGNNFAIRQYAEKWLHKLPRTDC